MPRPLIRSTPTTLASPCTHSGRLKLAAPVQPEMVESAKCLGGVPSLRHSLVGQASTGPAPGQVEPSSPTWVCSTPVQPVAPLLLLLLLATSSDSLLAARLEFEIGPISCRCCSCCSRCLFSTFCPDMCNINNNNNNNRSLLGLAQLAARAQSDASKSKGKVKEEKEEAKRKRPLLARLERTSSDATGAICRLQSNRQDLEPRASCTLAPGKVSLHTQSQTTSVAETKLLHALYAHYCRGLSCAHTYLILCLHTQILWIFYRSYSSPLSLYSKLLGLLHLMRWAKVCPKGSLAHSASFSLHATLLIPFKSNYIS